MIKNDAIISEVNFSYETLRNTRDFNLSILREKLLNIPEYKTVAEDLSAAIFEYNKADFEEDYEKVKSLTTKIEELKRKKSQFESKFGAEKFDYACKICNDSGESQNGKCQCFFDKITNACYKELSQNKPKLSKFEDDTLSKEIGAEKYYEKFLSYAENFNQNSKNVIFTGKTGTGKTFLSQAITNKVSSNKNIALFLTASDLNNIAVENMYSSPAVQKSVNDILETCDFLVIDDLGAERLLNKITVENLYVLISKRNDLRKPYLITTNLTMQELQTRYGDRLFSRITGKNTVIVNFDGSDLRKHK